MMKNKLFKTFASTKSDDIIVMENLFKNIMEFFEFY